MRRIFNTSFIFILLLLLTWPQSAHPQSPWSKQWDFRFGGRQTDFLNVFFQTSDGGYILAGSSLSGFNGDKTQPSRGGNDFWIVKTDGNGIKQWDKRFGGSLNDFLISAKQTNDDGFILAGSSTSGPNGDKSQPGRGLSDYWIVKLDAAGIKEWDKSFGGNNEDFLSDVIPIESNGYLLAGYSRSDSSGDKTQATKGNYDYWIIRVDSLGNKSWDADLGGIDDDQLTDALLTDDGGFLLGGSSNSGIGGDKTQASQGSYDYWIIKTDSNGIRQWDKQFGGNDLEILGSVKKRSDGGYLLGGFSRSGISGDKTIASWGADDYWLIKTDSSGNIVWDKDFGSTGIEDDVGSAFESRDGGYLICGESQSPPGGDKTESNLGIHQAWIVKTDSSGLKEWEKTILTAPENKITPYIIQTKNGCFVIAFASWSDSLGYKTQRNRDTSNSTTDYWMIKYCDTTLSPLTLFTADQSLCPGTCTSFENLSLYATSYQWNFNGASTVISSDENPENICYNTPGSYDVTLITTNSNGSDTLVLPNFISVYNFPPPQSITQIGDTLFALQGVWSYQWFFNGLDISGATDYFYVAQQSGDYNVVCTDSNGCEVEAVIFGVLTGVENTSSELMPQLLFPNPAKNSFTLSSSLLQEFISLSVFNQLGEEIYSSQKPVSEISCISFPSGSYLVEITGSKKVYRQIFVKL